MKDKEEVMGYKQGKEVVRVNTASEFFCTFKLTKMSMLVFFLLL